ncbi:MAG: UDP-glucose 4-epimerase GalE [Clostridia bacterium]|nr:UDP-glucose 4-epimerase GalE [Clostridia bacterium]
MKTILITGGAGYIGSHTIVELVNNGFDVVVVDNLSNSKFEVIKRVENITNKPIKFYKEDILDKEKLRQIFMENKIDACIHFAGFKAVGESCKKPLMYYHNNITGTLCLLEVMKEFNCKNLIFSSSATVYGSPATVPITEDFPLSTTNPYGTTKLFIERILEDVYTANPDFNIGILRYFNPIGASKTGLIGEDPNGIPNNLCPYITKVLFGKLEKLSIFGNDYPTHDGTGVRDYIHVEDLAMGHRLALNKLFENSGLYKVNLGTGKGYSVLDIVKAFEKVSGKKIPYQITERRSGDIATCYADTTKAKEFLGFEAQNDLEDMVRDAIRFQEKNPNGIE